MLTISSKSLQRYNIETNRKLFLSKKIKSMDKSKQLYYLCNVICIVMFFCNIEIITEL